MGSNILESLFVYDSSGVLKPVSDGDKIRATKVGDPTEYIEIYHENGSNARILATSTIYIQPDTGAIAFLSATTTMMEFRNNASIAQNLLSLYDNGGNQLVLGNSPNALKDNDHALQPNPTIFVQSDTDPDTANDEWISQTHDVTDGVIDTGSGYLRLKGANGAMLESVAGNNLENSNDADSADLSAGAYFKVKETTIPRDGTYRIKFTLKTGSGTSTRYGRIYRNGVAVGTAQSVNTAAGAEFSEDISGWKAEDLCQIYAYNPSNSGYFLNNFRIYSGNGMAFTNNL